jgi:hypothetical protein
MTAKFASAIEAARRAGIKDKPTWTQEELYAALQKVGRMWDSDQKEWIDLSNVEAEPATDLIMVRVWSDSEIVDEVADELVARLKVSKFKLVERSESYLCRPPKQLEARVYLKFFPPTKRSQS